MSEPTPDQQTTARNQPKRDALVEIIQTHVREALDASAFERVGVVLHLTTLFHPQGGAMLNFLPTYPAGFNVYISFPQDFADLDSAAQVNSIDVVVTALPTERDQLAKDNFLRVLHSILDQTGAADNPFVIKVRDFFASLIAADTTCRQ